MKLARPSVWVLGFVAFVMNPAFACSSSAPEDDFHYGEKEMIDAVQGTWRLTFSRSEGTSVVTFDVAQGAASSGGLASPPGVTPQCAARTFTRPAAACSPMSTLALEATVLEAEPPLATADGTGWFRVTGTEYRGGGMELRFGTPLVVNAVLDAGNGLVNTTVTWQGSIVTSVLERTDTK